MFHRKKIRDFMRAPDITNAEAQQRQSLKGEELPEVFQDLARRASAEQAQHTSQYVSIANAEAQQRQRLKDEGYIEINKQRRGHSLMQPKLARPRVYSVLFSMLYVSLALFSDAFAQPDIDKNTGIVGSTSIENKTKTFSDVLQPVMPAVVNITVQGQLKMPQENMPPQQQEESPNQWRGETPKFNSVGSGVIVDGENGYIVTNAHLLREAKTIVVMLSDGRKLRAHKVGVDELTDLAVLQIEGKKLTSIPFADISKLKVGDFVAAIGNPFGLKHTVTSGMVSALNRSHIIDKPKAFENFIQTDASINPGNSGGALINIKGELVGINTAIVGPISGNVGIGFAVPVDMVYPVMQQLVKYGRMNRGVLGISVQDFTPNLADAFNMPGITGALITKITGGPAETAGLQARDVILKMNNTPIKNAAQLRALIAVLTKNTTVALEVRRGKEIKKLKATIGEDEPLQNVDFQKNPLSGVQLQNYDAFSLETGELKGVEITFVDDNSDAWIAGLRGGDIILSAYGQRIESIDALLKLVNHHKDKSMLVNIWRSGGSMFFCGATMKGIPSSWSYRLVNLLAALLCAAYLSISFLLESYQNLLPCPLCILQRFIVFLLLLTFLGGSYFARTELQGKAWGSLTLGITLLGVFFASRHLWLIKHPLLQEGVCAPDLFYLFKQFPFAKAARAFFWGSGDCSIAGTFLQFSIPFWTLLGFLSLTVISLWQIFRIRQ